MAQPDRKPTHAGKPHKLRPLYISLIYLLYGALWIFFSDRMATAIASSEDQLCLISSIKGWLFVGTTSLLLYFVLSQNAKKINAREQALAKSEEHLKAAQFTARIGSWEQDGQTDTLTWSDTVYDLFGMTPKNTSLTTEEFLQLVHPDDQEWVKNAFIDSQKNADSPYDLTHRIIRADTGAVRFMHEHCTHFRDAKGNIVKSIGTVQDITEQVQSKERVKSSETFMKRTQAIAHVGSWKMDLETNVLTWSDEAYRIFGVAPEKFNGTYEAFLETVHPDDRERVNTAYTNSIRNNLDNCELEHRVVWPDGSIHHIHEKCLHERDPKGTIIRSIGFSHDITDRKLQEMTLLANQKLLDDTINAMPDMLWMKDIKGAFLTCNREFEKLAGVSRDELIGTTDYDHFNKDQADICCEQDTVVLESGAQSTHIEPLAHATHGGDVWYEVIKTPVYDREGKPLGVLGVGRDITERQRAENAQAQSEEKYRALFNNAPLPYQSLNEDGCFLDVNPAWLRILGYDRDEVIGHWFGDFLHPDFVPHFETNFPAFKKRGCVKDVQFRIRHKNGTYRHIEFEGCIGYLPDGSFRQTYCVFQDITERKLAEERLAASEERFRTICENAPALINGFDETGRCLLWNRKCRETFGWTLEEINEHEDGPRLFYPDPIVREEMLRSVTTEPNGQFREWHPVTRDGRILTTSWANFQLPDGQIFSLGLDITEQRQAQEELKRYRGQLEARVEERTEELQTIVNAMAGREVRMAELKEKIIALNEQLRKAGIEPVVTRLDLE